MASHMNTNAPEKTSSAGFSGFNLPRELEPMGTWAYIGFSILYAIPLVGLICMIVFSISGGNLNRRNFTRSCLFFYLIGIVLYVVLLALGMISLPPEVITSVSQVVGL
ncbi:MAG: hypothetical protein ACOX4F_02565 [Atopobiaceae bacterium]|jgi:phosphoglycerol transferase MdoB-like AlkP superfamily enzyme